VAVSNEQSGYPGPYGQQPQYGSYPPPPPPPRGSNKVGVIAVVVGALLLVGSGIFVVSRFSNGSGEAANDQPGPATTLPAGTPTAGTQPTKQATTQPTEQPTAPPPSKTAPAVCNGCFPGVTVSGLLATLKSRGFACKEDRVLGIDCSKGNLDVGIHRDYTEKNFARNIDVGGSAGGPGNYPQGPRQAFAALKAGLPGLLPLFLPDAAVRQQIAGFTNQHAGQADQGPSTVKDAKFGGYRVSIHGVSGATVGKGGRSASSYSTSVYIYGPSAY